MAGLTMDPGDHNKPFVLALERGLRSNLANLCEVLRSQIAVGCEAEVNAEVVVEDGEGSLYSLFEYAI